MTEIMSHQWVTSIPDNQDENTYSQTLPLSPNSESFSYEKRFTGSTFRHYSLDSDPLQVGAGGMSFLHSRRTTQQDSGLSSESYIQSLDDNTPSVHLPNGTDHDVGSTGDRTRGKFFFSDSSQLSTDAKMTPSISTQNLPNDSEKQAKLHGSRSARMSTEDGRHSPLEMTHSYSDSPNHPTSTSHDQTETFLHNTGNSDRKHHNHKPNSRQYQIGSRSISLPQQQNLNSSSPIKPRVRIAQPSHDIMPGFESKLMMSQPLHHPQPRRNLFALQDGLAFMSYAAQAIAQDEFSKCFVPKPRESLLSGILKGPAYMLGFLIRYLVLFPYRLVLLLACSAMFFTALPIVLAARNEKWQRWLFKMYCKAFVASWGSRIRVHGKKPRLNEPQVFVSNHTSFIDYIILSSHEFPHAIVGQKHGGLIGYFQTRILALNGSLIFNRGEKTDRAVLATKMKQHVSNGSSVPLLIFPEGTCVNNEYTVLFHKGAFDLGVTVCPVAIRYNKAWADAYWHTKTQTFTMHLLYLMTRWALVVDIWYLPPRRKSANQTSVAFSNQVKAEISSTAGLKNLSWDGYFKNFAPPEEKRERLKQNPQLRYGAVLKNRLKSSFDNARKRGHVRRSSSVIESLGTNALSVRGDGNASSRPAIIPKPLHLMLFDSSLKQALSPSRKNNKKTDGSEDDLSNDRITLIQNRILMALQDQDHRMDMIDAISDTRHDVVQTWKQHTKKIRRVDLDDREDSPVSDTTSPHHPLHDTLNGQHIQQDSSVQKNLSTKQNLQQFLEEFDEDMERRRMENSSWRAWFRQRILAQKQKESEFRNDDDYVDESSFTDDWPSPSLRRRYSSRVHGDSPDMTRTFSD